MTETLSNIRAFDIRFPTSRRLDGSDAMNPDPDYSAAYVIIETEPDGAQGHGFTFTIGRGNEICVAAIRTLAPCLIGRPVDEMFEDMGLAWRLLTTDSQLRWIGPEKGAIHLAAAALLNALWDLYARREGKPLWQLLAELPSEQLAASMDFTYLGEVLTRSEATDLLEDGRRGLAERLAVVKQQGFPAYTTSVGWLGYPDEKVDALCRAAVDEGWDRFKMKVGGDPDRDIARAELIRSVIGPDGLLMMDANQCWEIAEAIERMRDLARFDPVWIEEPTSPDDILGHAAIAEAIRPIRVATGEHVHNRIMFKQLFQVNGIGFCQLDVCRVGGVNEGLAILLMAAKFSVPVCPHAGGVGLCEVEQHISIFDYLRVGRSLEGRMLEYVEHLHDHFVDPVRVQNGSYKLPVSPGFSTEIHTESLRRYEYPVGPEWG